MGRNDVLHRWTGHHTAKWQVHHGGRYSISASSGYGMYGAQEMKGSVTIAIANATGLMICRTDAAKMRDRGDHYVKPAYPLVK